MAGVSVVIITKNEATNIADCIRSAKKISDDIIIIDSGSTDDTITIAQAEKVKTRVIEWQGYGHSRNTGAQLALSDWIFSLDADERITDELAAAIRELDFSNRTFVYGFKRENYFGNKKISYGAFAHDHVFRLYNRRHSQWNTSPIHEKLTGENQEKIILKNPIVHYAIRVESAYRKKITGYAILCAYKYRQETKKFIQLRSVLSPAFSFVKGYIFQLGFLDRHEGLIIAKLNAFYTRKKYQHLLALINDQEKNAQQTHSLQHSLRKIFSFFS